MPRPSPAAILLLAVTGVLALAARAAAEPIDPQRTARAALTMIAAGMPAEFGLLLDHARDARLELVRMRCEESFLDFVELMWPILDPGQVFVRGKVQEAIALHLEAVHHGKIKNFLGNVPPGSTKSYLCNVFFPAWEWGPRNRPDLRYMSWSYSPELTLEHNDLCRKIIKHEIYQRFWGDRFQLEAGKTDAKGFYRNNKGGWRRSSSIKGAGTGFRADRLIWDDPISVKDADSPAALRAATRWFARTLPTRVRNAAGPVDVRVPWWVRDVHGEELEADPDDDRPVSASATIGIMQRVHMHDISGIILKNPALGYEILLIEMRYRGEDHPARKLTTWPKSTIGYEDWREIGDLADPKRYPEEALAALEASLIADGAGADAVAAQLDQWPISSGGILFTEDWLPMIEPDEVPAGVDKRGWDFAGTEEKETSGGKKKKSDKSATACIRRGGNKKFYLMQSDEKHTGPAQFDDFIKKYHQEDPMGLEWSIPQDPGQAGKHQVSYIVRELTPGRYVTSSRELGKERSARPVSSQAQHKNFFIVRHPGWERARSHMIDFPYGDGDDLMDAISRAFAAHVSKPAPAEDHGGFGGTVEEAPSQPPAFVATGNGSGFVRDFDY